MSSPDPFLDPLPGLRARLREVQQTLDYLDLAMHNIGFAIAYGASEEAWPLLDELGRQRDQMAREIEELKAEIARRESADEDSPIA